LFFGVWEPMRLSRAEPRQAGGSGHQVHARRRGDLDKQYYSGHACGSYFRSAERNLVATLKYRF